MKPNFEAIAVTNARVQEMESALNRLKDIMDDAKVLHNRVDIEIQHLTRNLENARNAIKKRQ